MSVHPLPRRKFISLVVAAPLWGSALVAAAEARHEALITHFGAIADGSTVNTKAIQAAIDHLAARGGTVVIPRGVFVSGALFFRPKVNLHLEAGAVLRCSTDMANFPPQRTRIEGHFEEKFTPALINAKNCDGFHITGEGPSTEPGTRSGISSGSCATQRPTREISPTSAYRGLVWL